MRSDSSDLSEITCLKMAAYSLALQAHSEQKQFGLSQVAGATGATSGKFLNLTDGTNLLKVLG